MEALFASWPRDEARVLRMELYGKEPMLLLPKREQSYDLKAVLDEMPERRYRRCTHHLSQFSARYSLKCSI